MEVATMPKEEYEELGQLKIWKPANEGDVLEGEVVSQKDHQSYGRAWGIKTDEGEINTPAHKVLQNRMESVKIGDKVRITFVGYEPAKVRGQSPMAMYRVERKKA
jgi:hypothetical protein